MNPTNEQWRQFHYGNHGLQKPKPKPVSYSLIGEDGTILCTGAYSLCVYKKKLIHPIKANIRPNY